MEWVGDGCELRLQILVVEEILCSCHVEYIGRKLVQCMLEAFLGDFKGGGDELVAIFDCLLE